MTQIYLIDDLRHLTLNEPLTIWSAWCTKEIMDTWTLHTCVIVEQFITKPLICFYNLKDIHSSQERPFMSWSPPVHRRVITLKLGPHVIAGKSEAEVHIWNKETQWIYTSSLCFMFPLLLLLLLLLLSRLIDWQMDADWTSCFKSPL